MVPGYYLSQWRDIINWTSRYKCQQNLNQNSYILIQENAFENFIFEMVSTLSQPKIQVPLNMEPKHGHRTLFGTIPKTCIVEILQEAGFVYLIWMVKHSIQFLTWITFTCVGRLICPEGHVSLLNKCNPIQIQLVITLPLDDLVFNSAISSTATALT